MPGTDGVFGRGRELGAVAAFLDGVSSGPSGLVLEGEAGIGFELAGTLGRLEGGYLPGDPLPVPAGLQGVLSARITALPAEVQDILLALRVPQRNWPSLRSPGPGRRWGRLGSGAAWMRLSTCSGR